MRNAETPLRVSSQMRTEIHEIPSAVDQLLSQGQRAIEAVCDAYDARDLRFLVTVARGSSGHACTYMKYLSELLLGLPAASVGPSVSSVYGARLRVDKALCLAVSQSGQSPDSVQLTRALRAGGGLTVAITNDANAPLATEAHATLELLAGREQSVAATKTFVSSVVAGVWLIAALAKDQSLLRALRSLPEQLASAIASDWSPAEHAVAEQSLYTLGRGVSLAVSNEAALKFKETCQLHAESYSSAEVQHGPMSLVDTGFPVLAFAGRDAAERSVVEVADQLAAAGATVFVTSPLGRRAQALPRVATLHPLLDPIALIVSFYSLVERVAMARGVDPDAPRHLRKVTQTL
ncbi:MAG: SIS domain-containing protein [Pseudomonadota bacterium]